MAASRSLGHKLLGACYAGAVLVSACLVFQVQLLISKTILPWFGGTPAVWTTSMLFFQVALFAGYAYAHWSVARLKPATQGMLHLLLIFLAIAFLPVAPTVAWKPESSANPVVAILGLLTVCVGIPFFVLSATGPLIQGWFARTHQGLSPYRLYALSNLGSMIGLISYPFLVEPQLPLTSQSAYWSLGFTIFAVFCGYCAVRALRRPLFESSSLSIVNVSSPTLDDPRATSDVRPTKGRRLSWLGLSCCASVMLLATTNHVCQDVAVIPFLWVLPLTLYLLTFIVCFEKESWCSRRWCGGGAAISLAAAALLMVFGKGENLLVELGVCMAAMFFVCMVCHGELVRRKPDPRYLTEFYLMSSAGGALGGVFVALVAPLIFNTHLEYTLALLAGYVLAVKVFAAESGAMWSSDSQKGHRMAMGLALLGLVVVLRCQTVELNTTSRLVARSFYGVLRVDDIDVNDPHKQGRALRYGRILHGYQYLAEGRRREPTLYFDSDSGIGLVLNHHPGRKDGLRVGIVGLGVGTIAAYGQAGDDMRFYEINPDVVRAAREEFTFLADCPARTEVVLGDARLSLEREPPQEFDVLALDAFSGDAIPTHLLTSEAMDVYLRHLRPNGTLAVQITNRHVDIAPVLQALADHAGLRMARVDTKTRLEDGVIASNWAILTKSSELLNHPAVQAAIVAAPKEYATLPLWTDDYSNIFRIMR